jgi:hypothetical protein
MLFDVLDGCMQLVALFIFVVKLHRRLIFEGLARLREGVDTFIW